MYKNEKTAPYAPTATGAEQSNQTSNSNIIAENSEDFKGEDINYQEIMRRMADPYYIHVMTLSELFDTVYKTRQPIIDGLLCGSLPVCWRAKDRKELPYGAACLSCQHG